MTTLFVVLVVVSIGVVVAGAAHQSWIIRTGAVPHAMAHAEQADLLQAIRSAATEPQMRITLNAFWRGRGWNRRQRYCLLLPLIQQRILHVAYSDEPAQRMLEALWFQALAQPPSAVILCTRDWMRMATDPDGRVPSIIIGDITGGMNQIGGSNNTQTQQDLAAEQIFSLIRALRDEAPLTPEVHEALRIADDIEEEFARGRMGRVTQGIQAASKLVQTSAATMESTRKILHSLGLL